MMPIFQACTLGSFQILKDGEPLSEHAWRSKQTRLILKYMITRRNKTVTTDQLMELLWPDEDPNISRERLHIRMSQLRRILDPLNPTRYIHTVEGGYIFTTDHDFMIDLDKFEECLSQAYALIENKLYEQAIPLLELIQSIYKGDFLPEDLYEEWTVCERERLQEVYLNALTELGECYALTGRYHRAIELCLQILGIDPCREAIYVRLMLYYYYAGELPRAIRIYEQCVKTMREELGVSPLPSTTQLAEQIKTKRLWSTTDAPHYPPPSYEGKLFQVPFSFANMPFVGREKEYSWLISCWNEMKSGIILLEGEAGIGKTRLAEEFLGYAEEHGANVLRFHMTPMQAMPLGLWMMVLNETPRKLKSLDAVQGVPVRNSLANGDVLSNPFSNTVENLEGILKRVLPYQGLIFIDNAQWLDSASIDLIIKLSTHSFFLLTFRSEETPSTHPLRQKMAGIRRTNKIANLHLIPADRDTIQVLLQRLAGINIPEVDDCIYHQAGGNFLFIITLLQHLFEQGNLYITHQGRWEFAEEKPIHLPTTVVETIEHRLKHLSPEQRKVFDFAVVLRQDFDFATLQQSTQMTETKLLDILDTLMEAGLIVEPREDRRGDFSVVHDLYAQVAYRHLPEVRKRNIHGAVAKAHLKLHGNEPSASALIAYHSYHAGLIIEAVEYSLLAGQYTLQMYASPQAVTHFENAERWSNENNIRLSHSQRADLHLGWAEALRWCGRFDEAIHHYLVGLQTVQGESKYGALFQVYLLGALRGGGFEGFEQFISQLERDTCTEGDSWASAILRWTQSLVALFHLDILKARRYQAEGWRIARRLYAVQRDPPLWLMARAWHGLVNLHEACGNWKLGKNYSRKLLTLSQQHGDQNGIAIAHVGLGISSYWLGEWTSAVTHFQQALHLAVEAGDSRLQCEIYYYQASIHLYQGKQNEGLELAKRAEALSQRNNDLLHLAMAQILLARIAQFEEQPLSAVEMLQPIGQLARQLGFLLYSPMVELEIAEAYLRAGDWQSAWDTASRALELAQNGLQRAKGVALRIRGSSDTRMGSYSQAMQDIQQSVKLLQDIQSRYDLAQSFLALADLYQHLGENQQAIMSSQRATQILDELGIAMKTQISSVTTPLV